MISLAEKFSTQLARLTPFGKRDEDPISHIKVTTRWLDSLPLGNAFKCQQAIFGEIKRLNENSTSYTKDRLAIFMLLDEKSRDLQDTLVWQYLRNPRMSRAAESQLWQAVYGMYWELARGYHTAVSHLARQNGRDDLLPLVTLRAIRASGQLLKWRAIRYLPAREKVWQRLHDLYRLAESGDFHRRTLAGYPGESNGCSCETAYLHILMVDLANSGTLYPRQLDLLDSWLCGWHGMLQLEPLLDEARHMFAVDLASDHGARRVRTTDKEVPARYWSTADVLQKLEELHQALPQGEHLEELGLSDRSRTAESLDLIEHLQHHWAPLATREQRRGPRHATKRLVDVAHGISAIVGQIKVNSGAAREASPYGAMLDTHEVDDIQVYGFVTDHTRELVSHLHLPAMPASPDIERWVMHDESDFGFGAVVESGDRDWLRVGALLGIKSPDANEWRIAVVRRLTRISDDTSSVGIETLNEVPSLAILHPTGTSGYTVNGHDNTEANAPHSSVWLSGGETGISVILDPVHFAPGKIYDVHGVPGYQTLSLGHFIERSEGWMRVEIAAVNR